MHGYWSRNGEHSVTFAAFRETPELRFALVSASRSQLPFGRLTLTTKSLPLLIERQRLLECRVTALRRW